MTHTNNKSPKTAHAGISIEKAAQLPVSVLLCLFFLTVIRSAWVSDDAYITLRTVDNFVNGYGLTWNPIERVQGYTHPMWMLVLSGVYFFTRESFFTTIGLSVIISLAAVSLLALRLAKSTRTASFCLVVLCLSRAFTDYATSGLENPLTYLLLVIFCIIYFQTTLSPKRLFWMSLVMSLAIFNRMDTLLLYAPALLVAFLKNRSKRSFYALALGQLPFILWLCFATFYYGFPAPNTAYAKLNTGIPMQELYEQGFYYLLDSLTFDPLTLITILSSIILLFLSKKWRSLPLAIGVILYLAYTVSIGGDFMRGRFLAAPFLCAVILLADYDFSQLQPASTMLLFVAVFVTGLSVRYPAFTIPNVDFDTVTAKTFLSRTGIADELLFYYPDNGLLAAQRGTQMPDHAWKEQGLQLRAADASVVIRNKSIGMYGFYAEPKAHIVDQLALTDPLLARLPTVRDTEWRIGHFSRYIPEGYIKTLQFGSNVISDKNLALFYDKLTYITRGKLFDPHRWLEILKMNTGQYDDLIDFDAYRYPTMTYTNIAGVSTPKTEGAPWNQPGNLIFDDSGITVELGATTSAGRVEISLEQDDRVRIIYLSKGKIMAEQEILPTFTPWSGLTIHHLEIPTHAAETGYDTIRILPVEGDIHLSLGHIILWDPSTWVACTTAQRTCTIAFNAPTITQLLGKGWSVPESWGIWSEDATSTMNIYVEPEHDYDLSIEAFPFELDGMCDQSIRVWWNDVFLGEGVFTSCETHTFTFAVPNAATKDEQNLLQFKYRYFYAAEEGKTGGDQRPLSVGFIALRLTQK